jgi:hypothetical protein
VAAARWGAWSWLVLATFLLLLGGLWLGNRRRQRTQTDTPFPADAD